jgi:hypothetical protein
VKSKCTSLERRGHGHNNLHFESSFNNTLPYGTYLLQDKGTPRLRTAQISVDGSLLHSPAVVTHELLHHPACKPPDTAPSTSSRHQPHDWTPAVVWTLPVHLSHAPSEKHGSVLSGPAGVPVLPPAEHVCMKVAMAP